MIPLEWDEIVRPRARRAERGAPADGVDPPDPRRLAAAAAGRPLRRAQLRRRRYVDDALARGAATLVPHDQDAALAALASLVRDRSDADGRRRRRLDGQDVDEGRARCPLRRGRRRRSRPRRAGTTRSACRSPCFGLEPETEVLVTEMGMRGLGQIAELCAIARPQMRRRHAHRAGAPRARRHRRRGRASERRGDRGAAARRCRRRPGRRPRARAVSSTRADLDVRRFDRAR